MSLEPKRKIEEELEAYRRQRERQHAGIGFEMPETTRRLLHQELERQHRRHTSETVGLPFFLDRLWPRLALGGSIVAAVVALAVAVLWEDMRAMRSGEVDRLAMQSVETQRTTAKTLSIPPEPDEGPPLAAESLNVPEPVDSYTLPPSNIHDSDLALADAAQPRAPARSRLEPSERLSRSIETESLGETPRITQVPAPKQQTGSPQLFNITQAREEPPTSFGIEPETDRVRSTPALAAHLPPSPAGAEAALALGVNASSPDSKVPTLAFGPPSTQAPETTGGLGGARATATNLQSEERFLSNQQTFTQLGPNYRQNYNSPPLPKVLNQFQAQQLGDTMLIVDYDGSTYRGSVRPAPPEPAPGRSRAPAPTRRENHQAQPSSERVGLAAKASTANGATPPSEALWFRVVGTNRTLNQMVVFEGNYIPAPSDQINRTARGQNTFQFQNTGVPPTAPLLSNSGLGSGRIEGRAIIGGTDQVRIEAVPVSP